MSACSVYVECIYLCLCVGVESVYVERSVTMFVEYVARVCVCRSGERERERVCVCVCVDCVYVCTECEVCVCVFSV